MQQQQEVLKNTQKMQTSAQNSPACVYALGSTFLDSHTTRKADKIYSSLAIHSVDALGLSFSRITQLNFSWIALMHC